MRSTPLTLRQARWGAVLATIALGACGTPPAASRALPAVPADEPSAVMPWADSPEPEFVTATLPDHDGAPLLLLAPSDRPGTRYMGELLRTEGFTTFDVAEIATPDVLAAARIIIAGVDAVRDDAAGPLRSAVERGADLLLVRPTGALAELAGLEVAGERQGGVLIRAGRFPLQVHGPVATYRAVDAEVRAEVRAELEGEPVGPGVTVRRLAAGGRVIALSFDPVQSVVQARQGNPAWANTSRDGFRRFRSTDLFFGGVDRPAGAGTERDPDHVLWPLAVTPQADEHLRLLRELIVDEQGALPLPRIDYLPRGRRAAVLMTGDDHGSGGTAGRFARFGGLSPPGCRAERWECVRGSSYVDPSVRLDPASVSSWLEEEFEIGLHVAFDEPLDGATYADVSATQGAALAAAMPELPPASSRRNHGAATSGYAIQAKVLSQGSTRLDVNGYYWPPSWVASRPPYANGTLLPMRFADVDGTTIDAFGLPTVWTDESGQAFPDVADTMMDAALDPDGWPGIFTSNFHTDMAESPIAEAVIASAQDRGVAVISGRQLMQWWEAREAVVISNVSWDGARLEFDVLPHDAAGARLELPARLGGRAIQLQRRGQPAPAVDLRVERGREVASVEATPDRWTASWGPSERPPLEAKPACTAWSGLPSTLLELRGLRRRPDGALLTVPLSLGHPGAAEDMAGGAFGRGGASRAAGGGWILDHAWLAESAPRSAPATLRSRVRFGAAPYQSVGFAAALADEPMAIVTTGAGGPPTAFTRAADGAVYSDPLPLVAGQEALIEIDWRPEGVVFSVDGQVSVEHPGAPSGPLYAIASDFQLGSALLYVVTLGTRPIPAQSEGWGRSGLLPRADRIEWETDPDTQVTVEVEDVADPDRWVPLSEAGTSSLSGSRLRLRVAIAGAGPVLFRGRCDP